MTQDTNIIEAPITTSQRTPFQHENVQSSGYDLPNRPLISTIIFPNGGLLTIKWECGCWMEAYYHNTNPEKFIIYDAYICNDHFAPPSYPVPWSVRSSSCAFYYDCRNCGFPMEEGEEFDCEGESQEVHNEIPGPNVEYFGGYAEGVDTCPICNFPPDYDTIYQQWNDYRQSY